MKWKSMTHQLTQDQDNMKSTTFDKIQLILVTIVSIVITILSINLSCDCVKLLGYVLSNKDEV